MCGISVWNVSVFVTDSHFWRTSKCFRVLRISLLERYKYHLSFTFFFFCPILSACHKTITNWSEAVRKDVSINTLLLWSPCCFCINSTNIHMCSSTHHSKDFPLYFREKSLLFVIHTPLTNLILPPTIILPSQALSSLHPEVEQQLDNKSSLKGHSNNVYVNRFWAAIKVRKKRGRLFWSLGRFVCRHHPSHAVAASF